MLAERGRRRSIAPHRRAILISLAVLIAIVAIVARVIVQPGPGLGVAPRTGSVHMRVSQRIWLIGSSDAARLQALEYRSVLCDDDDTSRYLHPACRP